MPTEYIEKYHLGEICWVDDKTLCQEGFCNDCQIHRDWLAALSQRCDEVEAK